MLNGRKTLVQPSAAYSWTTAELFFKKINKGVHFRTGYTKKLIRDTFKSDEGIINCDASSPITVTLIDPLSRTRMNFPCRSWNCHHLQCFDLKTFLILNEKKDEEFWSCPICRQPAPYESLSIDMYFSDVIKSKQLPANATMIKINKIGSWKSIEISHDDNNNNFDSSTPILQRKSEKKVEVIDLSSSFGSRDEDTLLFD